jgi:hypothetical protein
LAHHGRVDLGAVMEPGRLTCRAFREGDEKAILQVLNQGSERACSLDEWAWLFPPEEDGRAIVVGEENNEIVAVCAGAPVRFVVDGREWAGCDLRQLAARTPDTVAHVLGHFVDVFRSSGRFDLAMAYFDFKGASGAHLKSLIRETQGGRATRRYLYRAELARDWEPRLDELWARVRDSYPVAVVRNADFALRRFAGHPTIRHHRFLIFPRYSRNAVAFAVFVDHESTCCWLDLLWDHEHPGAVDLLVHISGRLATQWQSSEERLWLARDNAAWSVLERGGFRPRAVTDPVVSVRALNPELGQKDIVARLYLTGADLGACSW